jgi:hypothetical protein
MIFLNKTDNNPQKSLLTGKVLEKIKSGRVKMRPKAHFVLKTVLAALGFVLFILFALYLISFIVFALRISGIWFAPGFGFYGIKIFLVSLPWILISIAIILILILEILVKRFSFAYRRPILYSTFGIIMFVLLGSFIIGQTIIHPRFFEQAQERKLPVAGKFYRDFGAGKFRNAHRGIVSEITENGFKIKTPGNETLDIIITPETRFPFGKDIKENDSVMILGERDNCAVRAFGVRKVDDNLNNNFLRNHGQKYKLK